MAERAFSFLNLWQTMQKARRRSTCEIRRLGHDVPGVVVWYFLVFLRAKSLLA